MSAITRRTVLDARKAVQSCYRGADDDTVRQQLIVEFVQLWKVTHGEAERAARWALLEPVSLESDSSEKVQHNLPVVGRSTA